jgi:hypothetical protein
LTLTVDSLQKTADGLSRLDMLGELKEHQVTMNRDKAGGLPITFVESGPSADVLGLYANDARDIFLG